MAGHADRDALKRDLEQARLAWADIRHTGDVLREWAGREELPRVDAKPRVDTIPPPP